MPRRVNPMMLVGLVVVLVLSFGILADAQLAGGTASDAVGVGKAQLGKPFRMATDGPDTFSCVGLMRYILRTIGVDGNAPWVPEAYLSKYALVDPANLQPGDIVIMPDWATMYAGDGMLLNANEATGDVTLTPMSVAGEPLGIVRPPYGGQPPVEAPPNQVADPLAQPPLGAADPLAQPIEGAVDPLTQPIEGVIDPLAQPVEGVVDPLAQPVEGAVDPLAQPVEEAIDPLALPLVGAADPPSQPMEGAVDPLAQPVEGTVDPLAQPVEGMAGPPTQL